MGVDSPRFAIDSTPPNSDWELLRRFWVFVRPDAWAFVFALVATPLIALGNLAQPLLLKRAIDQHIVPGQGEGLTQVALLYLAAVIGAYILQAAYTLAIAWAGQRAIVRLRSALYRHALSLSQSFFDRVPTGKILTRLTSDLESLGEAIGSNVVTIALDGTMIVGTLVAMLVLDARLTGLLLLAAPPLLLVLEALRRKLKVYYLEVREAIARVNAYLAERIDGVEVVQLYRNEAVSERQFDERNERFRVASTTSNVYEAFMFALVDGVTSILVALMLFYGGGQVAELLRGMGYEVSWGAEISAGLLVAFIDLIDRLFQPLRDLSGQIATIQRATAALSKVFGLWEGGRPIEAGEVVPEELRGHLVLKDVRFRYREDAPEVLRGVDLEVQPGQVLAIVGATGSGKTTITRLLDRSYEGYEGSIELDGHELRSLDLAVLRRRVAAVRQDIQVFSETLDFNVRLGNERLGQDQAADAAALVHADAFVKRLGWEHHLRERGADLSVGEGQLLTFARTMAHDPDLIILDEATASIDSITEELVQDAIARILQRKTVIVIAHRLSTIQSADLIAVMDKGRVVEVGSHDELLAHNGAYAALVHAGQEAVGA